ncbi:dihydroorotate dehydrogenase [Fistulifera solaris]|uniref:Dihydroorotate dehydrogenase n=1 Tax=Fistulifera solaris TaxID=1519565 RepID=A0A1Z5JR90_FISSO|nr:dihydroorotate dehydrogenase [Fistulifera solaris]|eukprot:GAX16543.1 dihydroorotate dehydrogenase [Fistulifera solaris]
MTPDVSTTVAGIRLSTCIYNASGPRSGSAEALHKIAQSSAGAVLSKSATLLAQDGNPLPRTWQHNDASLNSEGLPNKGIDYYISDETISEILQDSSSSKPYMVSLSGKTTADNITMLRRMVGNTKIAAIELNLACPNIIGKPVVGYDVEQMKDILDQVTQILNLPPMGIKLPPYLDSVQFQQVATLINQYNWIQFVVSINTLGNATAVSIEAGMPFISSNDGFAGLSGPAVKYTALANVRKLRQLLRPTIDVVGVGGIATGRDVLEFLLCGAAAVQVGTQHWSEGPKCFDRLVQELSDCMTELGHESVRSIVGTLQPWNKAGAAKLRALTKNLNVKPVESPSSEGGKEVFYQALSAVLLLIVFMLVYDKFTTNGAIAESREL